MKDIDLQRWLSVHVEPGKDQVHPNEEPVDNFPALFPFSFHIIWKKVDPMTVLIRGAEPFRVEVENILSFQFSHPAVPSLLRTYDVTS